MRFPARLVVLAPAVSLLVPAGPALAQGEFRVNTFTMGQQGLSSIGTDAAGNFVIVWESDNQDSTGPGNTTGVYGQRYDAAGNPLGGEFRVNVYTTGAQKDPFVAMNGDGTFVVVWFDNGVSEYGADNRGVFFRRYDAAGNAVGGDFQVGSSGDYDRPWVTFTQGGEFVIAWSIGNTGTFDLRAQRFDSAGAAVGSIFTVNTNPAGSQDQAVMSADAAGNFVVVWVGDVEANGSYDIYARRFDAMGNPLGSEFQVNTQTVNSQEGAFVDSHPDGSFVVVWASQMGPSGPGRIKGRRYDSSGSPLGAEFAVSTSPIPDELFGPAGIVAPSVATRAGGGFLVTWWATGPDGSGAGALGRLFDAAGDAVGSEFIVNTTATGNQLIARGAPRPDGGFVVTWTGQDGDSYGTFAHNRVLSGDTTLRLSIGDVTVSEGASGTTTASFPVTLSSPSSGTVTVDFTTVDGTATAGSDYVAASGTLTFLPGVTAQSIDVTVIGDGVDETTPAGPSETFLLNLASPTVPVADGQGQATILNDDATGATPGLDPVPGGAITVGGTTMLTGANFTAGTRIKLFVNTGASIDDVSGSEGFTPAAFTSNTLTWDVPATIQLGQGFGSIFVVNTDQGFTQSATQFTRLYGDPADNLPTITEVGGTPLASMLEAGVPVAHADTVVTSGGTVRINGTGFSSPGVNLFAAVDAGADPAPTATPCAVQNYGPFFPTSSSTEFEVDLGTSPVSPTQPAGPANFQVVNAPYTGNVQSNSVSTVMGSQVSINSVVINGSEVQVFGTGFSCLSVINLFNLQSGVTRADGSIQVNGGATVVNLGGLTGGGQRVIPIQFVSASEIRFQRPSGAQAGPAFVEVLNPPYIPFSSSGNDPDGAFSFP